MKGTLQFGDQSLELVDVKLNERLENRKRIDRIGPFHFEITLPVGALDGFFLAMERRRKEWHFRQMALHWFRTAGARVNA